jgi:hypothetical protein
LAEVDELLGFSATIHSAKTSTVATRTPRSGRDTLSIEAYIGIRRHGLSGGRAVDG